MLSTLNRLFRLAFSRNSSSDGLYHPVGVPRQMILIRPRKPYVDWVRKAFERPDYTIAEARRRESLTVLVDTGGGLDDIERFAATYAPEIFTWMFRLWSEEESDWPSASAALTLSRWFDLELCAAVIDVGGPYPIPRSDD